VKLRDAPTVFEGTAQKLVATVIVLHAFAVVTLILLSADENFDDFD
jgi:hypothetical protein